MEKLERTGSPGEYWMVPSPDDTMETMIDIMLDQIKQVSRIEVQVDAFHGWSVGVSGEELAISATQWRDYYDEDEFPRWSVTGCNNRHMDKSECGPKCKIYGDRMDGPIMTLMGVWEEEILTDARQKLKDRVA